MFQSPTNGSNKRRGALSPVPIALGGSTRPNAGYARRSRRGVSVFGVALTLAIALPALGSVAVNWAEARADNRASALAELLREAGKGIEAALAAEVFNKADFAASTVVTLNDAQITTLFGAADVAPYLNITNLRGMNFDVLIGRQGDGPVEGVVLLQSTSARGALVLERMRNTGVFTNGQAAVSDRSGTETTTQAFMTASGRVIPAGTEFVAFSTANVADLDANRVIRQDRRVVGAPTLGMSTNLNLGGFGITNTLEASAETAESTTVVAPASGLNSASASVDSIIAPGASLESVVGKSIGVSGNVVAREGYVEGLITSGDTQTAFHVDLEGLTVSEDLDAPVNIALTSALTTMSADGGGAANVSMREGVIDSLTSENVTGEGFYAESIQTNSITTQTGCSGC